MSGYESEAPETPPRLRRAALYAIAGAVLVAALGVGVYFLAETRRPVIKSLDPAVGEPGGLVRVIGRGFGQERGDGRLEIAGVAPTESSYVAWTDELIVVRVPLIVDSGLVRVHNSRGRSNARFFMNRERLPERPGGTKDGGVGPRIESLSSAAAPIGGLVSIRGFNFGANRGDSQVYFAWSSPAAPPTEADASTQVSVSDEEGGYELWSDKELRVRVPDGAASGGLVVVTPRGRSEPLYFQIADAPGTKTFGERRTYALSYFVQISRIRSSGPNDLYLWVPRPLASASQRSVRVVSRSREPELSGYRGVDIIRLKDLQPGRVETVLESWSLQAHAVEVEIRSERVRDMPEPKPALVKRYTSPDRLVDSGDERVRALAQRIAGREKNPHRIAKAVYDYAVAAWTPDASRETEPLEVLSGGRADAYAVAIDAVALLRALGVPALPVSGYLIDDARRAYRHYWVEYWIYGMGWVPMDPFLGSGGAVGAFRPPFDERSRYFGGIDNRHLAFSRGAPDLDPMTPDGRLAVRERRHSLQDLYEEASGKLDAYTSFWSDVEITGIY